MDWSAIWLTARLAFVTSVLLLGIGLPLAYWLATTPWRGRIFVEAIVALPLVLPPTVLGFYVLLSLGPRSPIGRVFESVAGHSLPFSFAGLTIASVLYSLPFAVQPFTAAFRSVNRELVDAALNAGASPRRAFFRVCIPLAWPGLLAGMVLSFAHTLGEFGVVLMVGGNIPGVTRTVSVSIYDAVQSLDYESAATTSLFLLITSFVVLSITYALQGSFRLGWPSAGERKNASARGVSSE
ncbi:MAG TPA: molybdate ABC transporter permease subunit [Chthoniobacteraceae bacterium]|nr:molybdate ABC transporter permease subunit [Chthoniobacteraceae bacterium]